MTSPVVPLYLFSCVFPILQGCLSCPYLSVLEGVFVVLRKWVEEER